MPNENLVAKPRTRMKRLARGLFVGSVSLVALSVVASLIWKFSGSNQWELVGERNGVKVYALKSPGEDLEQIRAVARIHSTLAGLVKFMQDPDVCDDISCYESRILERVDDQMLYTTFRFNYPFPFRPREFVVRAHFYQNPGTKEVLLEYAATPDKLAPNDCCFRITRMNNTWRFTPLGNGEVEIECQLNMDEGGFMPSFLLNQVRTKMLFAALPGIGKLVRKPKYQQAQFDFVKER
jgi:hypothetical protein